VTTVGGDPERVIWNVTFYVSSAEHYVSTRALTISF